MALKVDSIFRHRDFRNLWIGQTVSLLGSCISALALPLVAVIALDASAFEVGLLSSLQMIADLVLGLPAGAWIDRMRRKPVLLVTDIARGALLASILAAWFMGVLSIYQLYAVALAVGALSVFFNIAYQSYLPSVVDSEMLLEGNSKLSASRAVANTVSTGLGGYLIQALSAPYALLLDSISFFLSAFSIMRIKAQEDLPSSEAKQNLGKEIAEGLRAVLGHWLLRATTITSAMLAFAGAISGSIYLVLLVRELGISSGVLGLVFGVSGIAGFAGSLLVGRITSAIGSGRVLVGTPILAGTITVLQPMVQTGIMLWIVSLTSAVGVGCSVLFNITQASYRQRFCPPELLGRVSATSYVLVLGAMPIGALLGGVLGELLGIRTTLWIAAVIALLSSLPLIMSPLRSMREIPSEWDSVSVRE